MTEQIVATSVGIQRVLAAKFHNEWSGTQREVPYCEILKNRKQDLSIRGGFYIKPTKDFGDNLNVANLGIILYIDRLNDHVEVINRDFSAMQVMIAEQKNNPLVDISAIMNRVQINAEILAYYLKTIADKVTVLLCVLSSEEGVDSIADLLDKNRIDTIFSGALKKHKTFLDELNGLHNGYKHTFSNLQLLTIIPQVEPVMFAMYKNRNSTARPTRIHHMICSNALDNFSSFIKDAREYTRGLK